MEVMQGSSECNFADAAQVGRLSNIQFEDQVGEARKCIETMPVYGVVRHELTLLQVWSRAQCAMAVVASDRLKLPERKDQKINEQREMDSHNYSYHFFVFIHMLH